MGQGRQVRKCLPTKAVKMSYKEHFVISSMHPWNSNMTYVLEKLSSHLVKKFHSLGTAG